jgi:S-disulfanyl-L-cysteine oxidoreductase SoxD
LAPIVSMRLWREIAFAAGVSRRQRWRGKACFVVGLCAATASATPAAAPAAAQAGRPRTIWDGVYTEAQAARGESHYRASCAKCHSDDLMGEREAPALVGPRFAERWKGVTAADMLQDTRRTMPQEAPDSLGTSTYVDLIAFMLKSNGSPAGATELPPDEQVLKQIQVTSR